MRVNLLICSALLVVTAANAQDQEKKLLDRLLKPDVSLQNGAQNKKFVAGGATLEKNARTKQFYVRPRALQKQFQGTRNVAAREFATAASPEARAQANLTTRSRIPNAEVAYSTAAYDQVRVARDAEKAAQSNAFPETRPFAGRGKSQKALSAQDRPLTIDQVRELLNKNK